MTQETMHNGAEGRQHADGRDERLEQALRGAYAAMDPTDEQVERMRAALEHGLADARDAGAFRAKAADGAAADAAGADTAAAAEHPRGSEPESGGEGAASAPAAPRKKASGWPRLVKVALPLAACLVVGAVAVSVAGGSRSDGPAVQPEPAQVVQSQDPATKSQAARAESANDAGVLGQTAPKAEGELMAMATSADEVYEGYDMEESGLVAGSAYDSGAFDSLDDFNTEEYSALAETGFVSTKANPLSTVSADVDTASYCNVRRMVADGYTLQDVPAGAVRIEEMLNYFDYGYAAPKGGDAFSMQAQSAVCPWNGQTQLLVLGFAAAPEAKAASKGSNLVFLIDVSGSMDDPDKLDLLQDSFATLLQGLGSDDRVSIVTYASGEEIVLEGASGDDDAAILKAIYKLRANGSTNGEAGLAQAYEVAQRHFIQGGVNRIIMASDGDLNVGMTSESDLYDFVDAKRQTGIYLSVLGFGAGNYKDNKMETLADHGNGSYHYIDCIEEAQRVLEQKLTANLVPFADDVKVQVEFNPAQVKAYRLIGYENRELADEDFRDDAVDAGDVGPGAQFTVAYEVVLADSPMQVAEPELKYGASGAYDGTDASSDWLTCTLRYHDFADDAVREQELSVDSESVAAQPGADWSLAAAVVEFGMLARDSDYAGTSSEDSIMELLAAAAGNDQSASLRKLVADAFGNDLDLPDGL